MALDRVRSEKIVELEIAKDLDQRADILDRLGACELSIEARRAALAVFKKYDAAIDVMICLDCLVASILQNSAGTDIKHALLFSRELIARLTAQSAVMSGRGYAGLGRRFAAAYGRHMQLLMLDGASLSNPRDLELRSEEIVLFADQLSLAWVRRDVMMYRATRELGGLSAQVRSDLRGCLNEVDACRRRVALAEAEGKTREDFFQLPGVEIDSPFGALWVAKRQLTDRVEAACRALLIKDQPPRELPTSLDKMRQQIADDDAIVLYSADAIGEGMVVVIRRTGPLEIALLAWSKERISREVAAFEKALLNPTANVAKIRRALSDVLWKPLGNLPKNICIVLTSETIGLPFECLETEGGLVVDRHVVRYALGLSDDIGRRSQISLKSAFVVGASVSRIESLAELPSSADEVDRIRNLLRRHGSVCSPESSLPSRGKTAFASKVEVGVAHVSTHSIVEQEFPVLDALAFPDDEVYSFDLGFSELSADLVVLSACRLLSKRGDPIHPISGICTIALGRLTRNIIAPLWAVDSAATRMFMLRFYDQLCESREPAVALAAAKQAFANADEMEAWIAKCEAAHGLKWDDRWRSPYFWAGFVLLTVP
jgi:CHAT domain-containing protein